LIARERLGGDDAGDLTAHISLYFSTEAEALREFRRLRGSLETFARAVLPVALEHPGPHPEDRVLPELGEVEIHLIDDAAIAELHERFMNDAAPTDIITFQHGEVFISLETAQRQAREYGQSLERELRRYVIHGLLHLNGHRDEEEEERRVMHKRQEAILERAEAV
jgi:rRNA maturation RNase YbeY